MDYKEQTGRKQSQATPVRNDYKYGTTYKDFMKKYDDTDMYADPDCPFDFEYHYKKHKDE